MSYADTLFFGIYPYVAFAICVIGCMVRFDFEPYSWKASSSQMLRKKNFRIASNLFHVGVLFILGGHFVGLLTPPAIYHHVISTEAKQLVAMVAGGIAGVVMLVGLLMLMHRRLTDDRVRANSSFWDLAILFMLLGQVLLGLATIWASSAHMDGSVMLKLGDWAQSIVTLQAVDAVQAITSVHIIYKLHIVLGLTLILVVPFTRLVHVVSAPVWYLGRSWQIVRQKA